MRHGITNLAACRLRGRSLKHLLAAMLFCSSIGGTAGCLNLGGKTTYVQEKPETDARLSALETRVGALEQAGLTRATASPMPQFSGEQSLYPPDFPAQP